MLRLKGTVGGGNHVVLCSLPLWDEWGHPNDITRLNWVPIHIKTHKNKN